MEPEILKFQITCAFQMAEARLENGQSTNDCLDCLESEIKAIIDGEIMYDSSGLAL